MDLSTPFSRVIPLDSVTGKESTTPFKSARVLHYQLWRLDLGKTPSSDRQSRAHRFEPGLLYHAYCQRGQCEKLIKDFKNVLKGDRLSGSRFLANFLPLLEQARAYRLMLALRSAAPTPLSELGSQQFDSKPPSQFALIPLALA